jgi:uncharacterized DUF497 family protein
MHTSAQQFIWDETPIFAGPMAVHEDSREDYGEQRMIGVGLLDNLVVLIVHVESEEITRIISMRKAYKDETDLFYEEYGI